MRAAPWSPAPPTTPRRAAVVPVPPQLHEVVGLVLGQLGEDRAVPVAERLLVPVVVDDRLHGEERRDGMRRSAVARARDDVTRRTSPSTSARTASAACSACCRPVSLRSGSAPPRPSTRPASVYGVTAWRTSSSRVAPVGAEAVRGSRRRRWPRPGRGRSYRVGHVVGRRARQRCRKRVDGPTVHPDVAEPVGGGVVRPRHPRPRPVPSGAPRRGPAPRGRLMSGCLIFQRPDICSTTSLESIRTSTVGARVELARGLQPGDQAAVLRDVVGRDADRSARSAITSPVSASCTTAPYAAARGCRASRRRPRR